MSGAAVTIERACLTLGEFSLRNIDLALDAGETLVILGPNGAGKSVCLEMIAGFHRLTAGRVMIGGRDMTAVPPERRRVSLMFQNFGLFPHLTVAGNIAFGLRARHSWQNGADKDISRLLAQLGIAHLADRQTRDLSPGEKQRTALARALAARSDLFLFDEPFSALDMRTREALRDDLKLFLRQAGAPAILVSHDQTDAHLLADRVAVMHQGEILQIGSVADVFRRPANAFVAESIGTENILPGRLLESREGLCRVEVGGQILLAVGDELTSRDVCLCVRADEIGLAPIDGADTPDANGATNRLPARVADVANLGPICRVTLDCGVILVAYVTHRDVRALRLSAGAPVIAEIAADAIHLVTSERTMS